MRDLGALRLRVNGRCARTCTRQRGRELTSKAAAKLSIIPRASEKGSANWREKQSRNEISRERSRG
eukprot:6192072-Pleurochrysis_carterae.AAC.1